VNPQQVNTLGGLCELAGLVVAVSDWLGLAEYKGRLKAAKQRLVGSWARLVQQVQRWRGRPVRHAHATGAAAAAFSFTGTASGVAYRPVRFDPDRPLEELVAALGEAVEQLRDLLSDERQQRQQAIAQAEQRGKAELAAEARRLDDAIAGVQEQVTKLDRATTGNLRLRLDGIIVLLFGIVLTTWPAGVSEWWPRWLTGIRLAGGVAYYLAWRLCRMIWAEIEKK
jgi:Sec-independent protein translocase protein TatA